jgi:Dehydratase family
MLWRNMAAMAAEEMLRANPVDGGMLLGVCDKTIPALLMAAASPLSPDRPEAGRSFTSTPFSAPTSAPPRLPRRFQR